MRIFVLTLGLAISVHLFRSTAAEETRPAGVVTIGGDKAVIARQSKSPDGRYGLAWLPKEKEKADWALLDSDLAAFYEKYEAGEVWVVDLQQARKMDTLVSSSGYIRPGTHRTLAAAWGIADDSGRRFALGSYDWKWGTDTLYLIDVGPLETRHAVIGPQLDDAVAVFLKRTTPQARAALNVTYLVAGLPEHGTKTGFADATTVLLPFTARTSPDDRQVGEGVLTQKRRGRGAAPAVTVVKITRGAAEPEPFSNDARLAKADAELNAVYAALMKKLSASGREQLRDEQRAWIEKRDKQAAETPADAGDSVRVIRDRALTQLTEQRTAELRQRLDAAAR